MNFLHNHVGYASTAPKTAMLQSSSAPAQTIFHLINVAHGRPVYSGVLQAQGPVAHWRNWHYWRADFSAVQAPGRYQLALPGSATVCVSAPFRIAPQIYGQSQLSDLLHYFKSQRCTGIFDSADGQCPVIDSTLRVDVHGGWYDASGDTSKYLSHLSYTNFMNPQQTPQLVWNLLAGRAAATPAPLWMDERIVDEALHGADFLCRMQHPDGYFYMTVFDKWSKDVAQRQISSYATQQGHRFSTYQAGWRQGGGSSIAALARASTLPRHGEFTSAQYLAAAQRGFAHLQIHNLEYLDDGQENLLDDYCALLAATELLAATAAPEYASAAALRAARLIARQSEAGWFWANDAKTRSYFHAAEAGLPYVALLRYLEVQPHAENAAALRAALRRGLECELAMTAQGPGNPLGYPRQYVQMPGQAGQVQFFFPHDNESGYWWQGENARLASLATAALWAARQEHRDLSQDDGLKAYAHAALDWIFGRNPFDACMMQGQGHNHPNYEDGYWNAPGGVCNGITAGQHNPDDIDFRMAHETDPMHSWRWGEQWLPHGAWLFLALAQL